MLEALKRTKRASLAGRGMRWFGGAALAGLFLSLAGCGISETPGASGGGPSTGSMGSGSSGSSGSGGGAATWVMGQPFSVASLPFSDVSHPLAPNAAFWGTLLPPYPTNAEWMNLMLGDGKNPVNILPYVINALDGGFEISVPKRTAMATSVTLAVEHDFSFLFTELVGSRSVTNYDLLSVTMQWSAGAGKTLTAPLVRGMPYVTALYNGLTPSIRSSHPIKSVNGNIVQQVMSDRFVIEFSTNQTWILYANPSLGITWDSTSFKANGPYTGVLRAAVVGPSQDTLAVLDKHREAYPLGGKVTATVTGDTATIGFQWQKQGNGPLLMMALPHHIDSLGLNASDRTDLTLRTIKGDMIGVTGENWTLTEPLPTISWSAPRAIGADKVTDVKTALTLDAVDAKADAADVYTFGKQVAKLARLALIAEELKDTDTAGKIRDRMKDALNPWLSGMNPDALKYDKSWKGLCTTSGLADKTKDSGQGYYNDHHLQYGYFLYAAAVIIKSEKTWFETHREGVLALARDIANPSTSDTGFPIFRHKDWFTGHSWGSGLFEAGDSRSQGSSSEAVNAWYSLYLLGLALNDADLTNVGRVLLATEIRSAQKYWHIRQGSTLYDEPFAQNRVVGVLWSNKAEYTTALGGAPEIIHGTQMLPFTPITEALLERDWVTDEYPVVLKALTATTDDGWRGLIAMDHAVIDPVAAWQEISSLQAYDSGNSKTNTTYWVATRPPK